MYRSTSDRQTTKKLLLQTYQGIVCDTKTEIGGIFAIQQCDIIKHCYKILVTNNLPYSSCPLEKRQN
ncbi:MAG: hypothetical protein VCF08_02410, partial [Alphaproteobacteria bacterium]